MYLSKRAFACRIRTRGHVGVGHAGNAIDSLRFREENRRWKEQSADMLLRNPEPFVVGELLRSLSPWSQ